MSIPFLVANNNVSSSSGSRPTGYTQLVATKTTLTNPGYSYDTPAGAFPDTVNYSTQFTSEVTTAGSVTGQTAYTGIGTRNGTLSVNLTTTTQDTISLDTLNEAISSVTLYWSKDGGSTWNQTGWSNGGQYSIAFTSDVTQFTDSVTISGATGDVQVRVDTQSQYIGGTASQRALATAYAYIYDIILV